MIFGFLQEAMPLLTRAYIDEITSNKSDLIDKSSNCQIINNSENVTFIAITYGTPNPYSPYFLINLNFR